MLVLFDDRLNYFEIISVFEEAGPYRARRGAGTSIFVATFSVFCNIFIFEEGWAVSRSPRGRHLNFRGVFFQKQVFSPSTAQFRPREHHAVIRLAMAISVHKFSSKKALCSFSSSKFIDLSTKLLFSTVYRRATAAGTVPRVPGRSTCIGHTRDELRSPYGGRVMII